jgi:hypothetical protein
MTTPHITEVRQSLLATLADLRNRESPMDVDRARAVAQVAGVLVDTARVEVEFLKATGGERSQFLESPQVVPAICNTPTAHNPFPANRQGIRA